MVDLRGKDKGNISLPLKLQSWNNEVAKNKPTIINMQRAFYNIKIKDITSRINRLEDRNDELVEGIETTNEHSSTVDAKTADEIANLYKQVYAQNDIVKNLKNQINTLENNRIQDKEYYEDKVDLFNQDYKRKKVELVSQIKVINAKINALEDFKKAQTALEEKYKLNDERMIINDKKVKEVLAKISRKFEFDKEMVKNEMCDHLLDLTAKFQTETRKRINLPNQRLMRENIILKNELTQISKEISIKQEIGTNLKNSAIEYNKNMKKRFLDTKQNIITAKIQDSVLKHLIKTFKNIKEYASLIKVPGPAIEGKYLISIENAQQTGHKIQFYLSQLQTLLHKERTKVGVAKYLQKRLECKIKAIIETIYDLKYIVMCVLKNTIDIPELSYTELLLFLQNILMRNQLKLKYNVIKSVESIPQEVQLNINELKGIPEKVEILTDIIEKGSSYSTISDMMKLDKDSEKEKLTKISMIEDEFEDIFEGTMLFDLNLEDYELAKEDRSESEKEPLSDVDEE